MTTKTIKEGQYNPSRVRKIAPNRWAVKSRSTPAVYAVARFGQQFKCGCKATSPTCYPITSVVVREMREKGWVVAVWTTQPEAQRQRRKTWTLTGHGGQTFWMTGRPAPFVRRPDKRAKFLYATADQWRPGLTDALWEDATGPFRLAFTTERS